MFKWRRAAQVFDTSMNFDLKNVRPFLERLNHNHAAGIDADRLARFTAETALDQERTTETTAKVDGKSIQFIYGVFMDDIGSPDLYITSKNERFIEIVESELHEFWDELGI